MLETCASPETAASSFFAPSTQRPSFCRQEVPQNSRWKTASLSKLLWRLFGPESVCTRVQRRCPADPEIRDGAPRQRDAPASSVVRGNHAARPRDVFFLGRSCLAVNMNAEHHCTKAVFAMLKAPRSASVSFTEIVDQWLRHAGGSAGSKTMPFVGRYRWKRGQTSSEKLHGAWHAGCPGCPK
jgi:hypothetical protein